MSQRLLAYQLQLRGYDMDKNVITRIETNKRYVTDIELKAFADIFHVSYEYLIEESKYSFTFSRWRMKLLSKPSYAKTEK